MGNGQSTSSGTKTLAKVARGDARAAQQVRLDRSQAQESLVYQCCLTVKLVSDDAQLVHEIALTWDYLKGIHMQVEEAKAGFFHTSKGRRAALAVAAGN